MSARPEGRHGDSGAAILQVSCKNIWCALISSQRGFLLSFLLVAAVATSPFSDDRHYAPPPTTQMVLEAPPKTHSLIHYSNYRPLHKDINYTLSKTSGSAIAEGPRDVLVSRNSATTKYRYCVALFA